MKLEELIIKTDGFYLGSQKIYGIQWPFVTCVGAGSVRKAWALCDDEGDVDRVYLSISQCCTGLLITFSREPDKLWVIDIVQLPIVASEAVLSPTQNYYAALRVTGQACNGKGTIQISDGDKLWEWVIKEK